MLPFLLSGDTQKQAVDGDDVGSGRPLEVAEIPIQQGLQTYVDLCERWPPIVLNILVSNTEDHLRNHGVFWLRGAGGGCLKLTI